MAEKEAVLTAMICARYRTTERRMATCEATLLDIFDEDLMMNAIQYLKDREDTILYLQGSEHACILSTDFPHILEENIHKLIDLILLDRRQYSIHDSPGDKSRLNSNLREVAQLCEKTWNMMPFQDEEELISIFSNHAFIAMSFIYIAQDIRNLTTQFQNPEVTLVNPGIFAHAVLNILTISANDLFYYALDTFESADHGEDESYQAEVLQTSEIVWDSILPGITLVNDELLLVSILRYGLQEQYSEVIASAPSAFKAAIRLYKSHFRFSLDTFASLAPLEKVASKLLTGGVVLTMDINGDGIISRKDFEATVQFLELEDLPPDQYLMNILLRDGKYEQEPRLYINVEDEGTSVRYGRDERQCPTTDEEGAERYTVGHEVHGWFFVLKHRCMTTITAVGMFSEESYFHFQSRAGKPPSVECTALLKAAFDVGDARFRELLRSLI